MFFGTFAGISVSHFQITFCFSLANTLMNVSSVSFGMEETGIADPRVKTMNPFSDPLANISNSYDHKQESPILMTKNKINLFIY